ncbi:TVP38/TMEM64 family protein [Candidatus Poribacteria bacterium]|nr:TVP38/TMEM64 family protein [Candidatus Poribacteria bacterium]
MRGRQRQASRGVALRRALAVVAWLAVAIGGFWLLRHEVGSDALAARLSKMGSWALLAYCAAYVFIAAMALPGIPLTLAGGYVFGVTVGASLTLASAMVASSVSFLIARHAAGDWFDRALGSRARVVWSGIEQDGWKYVVVVRLVPLFPFGLLNYAFGLTPIRFLPYAAASAVAMVPGVPPTRTSGTRRVWSRKALRLIRGSGTVSSEALRSPVWLQSRTWSSWRSFGGGASSDEGLALTPALLVRVPLIGSTSCRRRRLRSPRRSRRRRLRCRQQPARLRHRPEPPPADRASPMPDTTPAGAPRSPT